MRVYVVDGTPDEIRQALPGFTAAFNSGAVSTIVAAAAPAETDSASVDDDEDDEITYVSTATAREVLSRIELYDSQKLMLRTIYEGATGWVSATDLRTALGQSTAQFRGFMGAWGRRYTHTDGFITGEWFFEQEWNDEEACYHYRLPETVREAMRLEGIV